MKRRRLSPNQTGFTIVELMIATAVLSTIILLVTIMMVNIGNLFYKGVTESRVQNNTRQITEDVARRLTASNATPTHIVSPGGRVHALCIGSTRYVYVIGEQSSGDPVLWRDNLGLTNCGSLNDSFMSNIPSGTAGADLVGPHSRLGNFCVTGAGAAACQPTTSPYFVVVSVVYGDDDLLCTGIVPGSCNDPTYKLTTQPDRTSGDIRCKGIKGNQFCATSKLITTAVRRI